TAIPASFRARPRGLDREELQDRIRVHRPGDAAFRRGSTVGEAAAAGQSAYQPFQPEPEDELVLSGAEPAEGAPHVDNTPPGVDEQPIPPRTVAQTPLAEPPPPPVAAVPPPPPRIFRQPATFPPPAP